jgi:hypothetical protein
MPDRKIVAADDGDPLGQPAVGFDVDAGSPS